MVGMAPLFSFNTDAICCNNLIVSVYSIHSLVVLVNGKWLWNCNFSLDIFIPSLYSWQEFTRITIWCNIQSHTDLLSSHPTIVSSFPVVVLRSIDHVWIYCLFCYGAITKLIFSHCSWSSNIIWSQKFEKTKWSEEVVHENSIPNFLRQNIRQPFLQDPMFYQWL